MPRDQKNQTIKNNNNNNKPRSNIVTRAIKTFKTVHIKKKISPGRSVSVLVGLLVCEVVFSFIPLCY